MPSKLTAFTTSLPSLDTLRREFTITAQKQKFIDSTRQTIVDILNGNDSRLLLIVGPCSIHDSDSAMEYAQKLHRLSISVSDRFFIIMRTYFDKARSTVGWQGYAADPFFDGSENISTGIQLTRKLLLDMAELEMPTAAELLNPISIHYFNDLLSWGCIGARTTESQTHRHIASSLALPIGFKNNTSGCIKSAVNGALAATAAHCFMGLNDDGQISIIRSSGNQNSHIVLRGSENATNYDPASVQQALQTLRMANLPERLLIDCSHGNSRRQYTQQPDVFKSVMKQIFNGNENIRGLCLESFLKSGKQPIPANPSMLEYGVSITDSCLGWNETEDLIYSSYLTLAEKNSDCSMINALR